MTTLGLFVSDVDGTLVTPDKELTPAAVGAAEALRTAEVPFTLVSSRPPRGMAQIAKRLSLTLPFAAFNGGSLVSPELKLLEFFRLDPAVAAEALRLIEAAHVEAFVFADDAWLLRDPHGALTDRERHTVGFEPTVVTGFDAVLDRIDKLVAVSPDPAPLDQIERQARANLAGRATIERSQPYYLDFTHPLANKGDAVRRLAARIGADLHDTVVLGDMTNDVSMFRVAGFSIAMGQAPAAVKAAATAVTASNTEDGFAQAVRDRVLPRLAPMAVR